VREKVCLDALLWSRLLIPGDRAISRPTRKRSVRHPGRSA